MKAVFTDFIWVDYCIIGLIALSALIGLSRGLIREVFSLVIWGTALWLGLHYNHVFSVYLEHAIPGQNRYALRCLSWLFSSAFCC